MTNSAGTVETVGQGGIGITTKSGQTINVAVTPATKVRLTGEATPDFIKPGFAVEFTAEVDKKHIVAEKVTVLTVVTLTAERGAGLFAEESASASAVEQDDFGFAAGKGGGGANAAAAEKDAKKAEKHKPAAAIQLPGTCVVRGTVRSCKAGKLVVAIDHGVVKADLADNAQIAVNMADISQAKKGDAVTARGRSVRQGQQRMVQAESVTIKAAEPLTGGGKKRPPKAEKKGAPSKDGAGDDGGDPTP